MNWLEVLIIPLAWLVIREFIESLVQARHNKRMNERFDAIEKKLDDLQPPLG